MRTTMVLDAIEMARWSRGNTLGACAITPTSDWIAGRIHPLRERLAEIGAVPSIGTMGDSYNELAETVNRYKAELIYGPARRGPWKTVELATLGWVYSHNTRRLHGYLQLPPAEFEDVFYATKRTDQPLVEIQ